MVAEQFTFYTDNTTGCSLAKISMVAEQVWQSPKKLHSCSLAKISMVAELDGIHCCAA